MTCAHPPGRAFGARWGGAQHGGAGDTLAGRFRVVVAWNDDELVPDLHRESLLGLLCLNVAEVFPGQRECARWHPVRP